MVSQDIKGIKEANLKLKQVLLRLDLDVPVGKLKVKSEKLKVTDATRLEETLPTTKWLLESGAKVTAIGHLGRPEAANFKFQILNFKFQADNQYSLEPVYEWYQNKLNNNPNFRMLENLRFDAGEEGNSLEFSKTLAAETGAEIYVFEAFAVSHREHASVAQIPGLLPTYVGFRFQKELENLQKVTRYLPAGRHGKLQVTSQSGRKQRVLVIGGAKIKTKIPLLGKLAGKFDVILIGGKLVEEIRNSKFEIRNNQTEILNNKFKLAELQPDGLDIMEKSARRFAEIIKNAEVVVWNGPMGKFEEFSHEQGTRIAAEAVNVTKAYTVVGGGDTEAALTKFNLEKGIDWISSGGGAMLTYLAEGTVPFLEGLNNPINQ